MNRNDANQLIDEADLRVALRPFRTDRDSFAAGVESRIQAASVSSADSSTPRRVEQTEWLRVAASVVPIQLLGSSAKGITPVSLAKTSLGKKLVGLAALPTISLFLAISASIYALYRIRHAQRSAMDEEDADGIELQEAMTSWWKQFSRLIIAASVLCVVLMLFGFTLPLLLIMLISGGCMVSLVTRLGHAGIIDRGTVAGNLAPALCIVGQLAGIGATGGSSVHLLDQSLIQAILFGGGILLLITAAGSILNLRDLKSAALLTLIVALVGWFSMSLWAPIKTKSLQSSVEDFDEAPFSSSSWRYWSIPAKWLIDSRIGFDATKPHDLLQSTIAGDQNRFVLGVAFRTGLMTTDDVKRLRNLDDAKGRLLDVYSRDQQILSLKQSEYVIRALAMTDALNDAERRVLAERLRLTLEASFSSDYDALGDALLSTELLEVIEQPIEVDEVRDAVHRLLVERQRLEQGFGSRSGGFSIARELDHGNDESTAAAVELMQHYGVPDGVDVMALRSFLRPTSRLVHSIQSLANAAVRERLESVPGVSMVTWLDYLRYEQNLMIAVVMVLLCMVATFGSPSRTA